MGFLSRFFGGREPNSAPAAPAPSPSAPAAAPTSNVPSADAPPWWEQSEPDAPDPEEEMLLRTAGIDPEALVAFVREKIDQQELTLVEIPDNIMRMLSLLDDPDFGYHELTTLVANSPVLTAEFLKLASSPLYFRGGAPPNDLKLVLPRLGRVTVHGVLYLHASRLQLAQHPLFREVAKGVVDHCLAVALINRYLSHRYYPDQERAFQAGLLHDIGKLTILRQLSEESHFRNMPASAPLTEQAMRPVLAPLHQEAGEILGIEWQLPEEIVQCIATHHNVDPEREPTDDPDKELAATLTALTAFSDFVAKKLGRGLPPEDYFLFDEPAALALGIDADDADTVAFLRDIPSVITEK